MVKCFLFDIHGQVLSSFNEQETIKIKDTFFKVFIEENGSLHLCNSSTTDNRAEAYQQVINNLKNEIFKRKEDIVLLEEEITTLFTKIQNGNVDVEELGVDMGAKILLKRQHTWKINEIENRTKITVMYKKCQRTQSFLLPEGVYVKMDFFPTPIMWCKKIEQIIQEKQTTETEDMPFKSLRADKKVPLLYAVGGYNHQGYLASAERYDPDEEKWKAIPNMTSKRCSFGLAVVDDQLYAVGGYDGINQLSSAERYNPKTNKWSPIENMHEKIEDFGMGAINGQLYVVGGSDERGSAAPAKRYNPSQNKWTTFKSMKYARSDIGVVIINNNLYAIGGIGTSDSCPSSRVECYNSEQNNWMLVSSMNYCRQGPGVASLNGNLYALGGEDELGNTLSSVERYDIGKNKWTNVAKMNCPRKYPTAVGFGDFLYAIGGDNGFEHGTKDFALATVERYDPNQNKWINITSMSTKRCYLSSAVIDV